MTWQQIQDRAADNETLHYIGSASAMSGEINTLYWFSVYKPAHPEYGGWAFWKCGDWKTDKPALSNLDEIDAAGLRAQYVAIWKTF